MRDLEPTCLSLSPISKIPILTKVPIIHRFILRIRSCRFGTTEVSKSLTPGMRAVLGGINDFGVKRQ